MYPKFTTAAMADDVTSTDDGDNEVNNGVKLYTNSTSIFDHYFDDEVM